MANTTTTTKTRQALFWVTTALSGVALTAIGLADLTREPHVIEGLGHLGFPPYLASILGVWKVAGVVVILLPGLPRLKEWAYAGFFFVLTGAAASHVFSSDPGFMAPLVPLGLVMASRALLPARTGALTGGAHVDAT